MIKLFLEFFFYRPVKIIKAFVNAILEVNKRYATPQIKMTKPVKLSLFCLRLYLIFLVLLLFYKFWTVFTHR
jgi:hypothetical protein